MISMSALQTWTLVALVCTLILVCTLGPLFQDADHPDHSSDDDDRQIVEVVVEKPVDDDGPYDWAVDGL